MKQKHSKRELLLDFAEQIVINESANKLTLDYLAGKAGVSKGGLLYHFSTKEDLLRAMIARLVERFEEIFSKFIQNASQLSTIEAYGLTAIDDRTLQNFGSLLAAVSHDTALLEPLRKLYQKWNHLLAQSTQSEVEAIKIRFLFDGIFFSTLFQLPMPSKSVLIKICKDVTSRRSISIRTNKGPNRV